MTEDEAQRLLRDYDGFGGLEAWIAEQSWKAVPSGWNVASKVPGRSFLLEPFGNGLRITAITPSGRAPGEWGVWTVPGRSNDQYVAPSLCTQNLTPEERRARQADQLKMIRLRMMISQALEDNGITTPTGAGAAIGLPGVDAAKLLSRKRWRAGDLGLLEAAAAQLGVQVLGL